mmetsp:Transcript_13098/g.26901  ORF Transcript_13098/g.26901 Transcript_13098/m.26901 type:complete len:556 (-) Transcript_13098:90-1757(-)
MGGACTKAEAYDLMQLDFTYFHEERIIGKGGFGTVYAVRKKFGTKEENEVFFAAKELDKQRIAKIRGLAQMTMNELNYMIEISEGFGGKGAKFLMNMECAFQSPSKLYIVQDLMEGGDLHFNMMHRTRRKVFDLDRVKFYAACCLLGLEEIHSLGILHRDIKPANMLLDKRGYAKLADFGLCGRLDKHGHCMARGGTLSFMSPESRNKDRKGRHGVGHDFFGLGVMIFVMFTCQYPFSKYGNFNTVIQAHLSELSVGKEGGKEKKRNPRGSPALSYEDNGSSEISDYAEGSQHEANTPKSSMLRVQALELEQNALPAHYQLDKKTLKKLPNEAARDLVKSLLMMNEKYRLGHKGCQQVMKHKFFDDIDWEGMKNGTAAPPSRPDCSRASVATGELDLMKLLNGDDEEEEIDNLTAKEQALFEGFSYNPYLMTDELDSFRDTGDNSDPEQQEEVLSTVSSDNALSADGAVSSRSIIAGPRKFDMLSTDTGITEETIDERTGLAITQDNPYNNFNPQPNEMPESTPVCTPKGRVYRVPKVHPGMGVLAETSHPDVLN